MILRLTSRRQNRLQVRPRTGLLPCYVTRMYLVILRVRALCILFSHDFAGLPLSPELLYGKLQLEPPSRTDHYTKNARKGDKRHASVDERALEELQGRHPVVDIILAHRKLNRTLNSYIEPLPTLAVRATRDRSEAHSEGAPLRLHSALHQLRTGTGRLSSSDPNLQNLPTAAVGSFVDQIELHAPSGETGVNVRAAFVASHAIVEAGAIADVHNAPCNCSACSEARRSGTASVPRPVHPRCTVLIALDYSQIEMRVLAHVCGDAALRAIFASVSGDGGLQAGADVSTGRDIYAAMASRAFGVPPSAVSTLQRTQAKVTVLGLVYGKCCVPWLQAACSTSTIHACRLHQLSPLQAWARQKPH